MSEIQFLIGRCPMKSYSSWRLWLLSWKTSTSTSVLLRFFVFKLEARTGQTGRRTDGRTGNARNAAY